MLRCQTESRNVQTVPGGKCLCPDFRAFKIAYVQTFVRSLGNFERSKIDYLCVHVQTIVRSKDLTPFFSQHYSFVSIRLLYWIFGTTYLFILLLKIILRHVFFFRIRHVCAKTSLTVYQEIFEHHSG